VFFAVKIETPRDANTHDGHVKSRGSLPRSLGSPDSTGCQREVHGSVPRTRYASRPSACRNGHRHGPHASILATRAVPDGLAACVFPYRGRFHHSSVVIRSAATGLRRRDCRWLFESPIFCDYSNDTWAQ